MLLLWFTPHYLCARPLGDRQQRNPLIASRTDASEKKRAKGKLSAHSQEAILRSSSSSGVAI